MFLQNKFWLGFSGAIIAFGILCFLLYSADSKGYNRCLIKTELEKSEAKIAADKKEKENQNEITKAKNFQQNTIIKNSDDSYSDEFLDKWMHFIETKRANIQR